MTEAEAKALLVKRFPDDDTHRWNVEVRDDGVYFCRGLHERAAACDWEQLND